MKKIILNILLVSGILFTGCTKQPTIKTVYVYGQCPTFDAKLKVTAKEHTDQDALVSWDDIDNISTFLKQKEVFNAGVKKLNLESNLSKVK